MIKRLSIGVAFAAGLSCLSSASLVNASFENPPVSVGTFTTGLAIPGWDTPGLSCGVWHLPTSGVFNALAPDGLQIGYCNESGMAQTSTNVIGVGTNSISVEAGRRGDFSAGGFTMQLWAGGHEAAGSVTGGTLLASVVYDYTQFSPNTFTLESASYVASANDPHLGQAITVAFVRGAGAQMDFDDVRVTAPTAPEPSSVAALGLGILAIALRRRSKRA